MLTYRQTVSLEDRLTQIDIQKYMHSHIDMHTNRQTVRQAESMRQTEV